MIDMVDPSFAATRYVERVEDGYVVHVTPPPIIGTFPTRSVMLTDDQYQRYLLWREGPLKIQDALPELTADEREILMSGLDDNGLLKCVGDDND